MLDCVVQARPAAKYFMPIVVTVTHPGCVPSRSLSGYGLCGLESLNKTSCAILLRQSLWDVLAVTDIEMIDVRTLTRFGRRDSSACLHTVHISNTVDGTVEKLHIKANHTLGC